MDEPGVESQAGLGQGQGGPECGGSGSGWEGFFLAGLSLSCLEFLFLFLLEEEEEEGP